MHKQKDFCVGNAFFSMSVILLVQWIFRLLYKYVALLKKQASFINICISSFSFISYFDILQKLTHRYKYYHFSCVLFPFNISAASVYIVDIFGKNPFVSEVCGFEATIEVLTFWKLDSLVLT